MKYLYILFCLLFFSPLHAQLDELESMLEEEMGETTSYASATFKTTRILNGHSIERVHQGEMDFRVDHRFGRIRDGFQEFYGLDYSSSYFSFEYGITDWVMIGIGRGSYDKTLNGFTKFSILRQCSGKKTIPVSVSLFSGLNANTTYYNDAEKQEDLSSRFSYTHQILIARKITPKLSLQLSPSFLHRNLVATPEDDNDLYALGAGGRFKLTNRTAISFEYFYVHNITEQSTDFYHPLSFGFDIETGSHIFQLLLTNGFGMTENSFLGKTTDSWANGDIHFGFNMTRVFELH